MQQERRPRWKDSDFAGYATRVFPNVTAFVGSAVAATVLLVVALIFGGALFWTSLVIIAAALLTAPYRAWRAERNACRDRVTQMQAQHEQQLQELQTDLDRAQRTIVPLMGGNWDIFVDSELVQRLAQASGLLQLGGHDRDVLYRWTRMALQGVALDHAIDPINQLDLTAGWQLRCWDITTQRRGVAPLDGAIRSLDFSVLRDTEDAHKHLLSGLRAEHFVPPPPRRQVADTL